MIPETREFEFANLGFIPLSYYKNRDYACFFSANSAQKPALYDTADATANSRINARLPYIFLLSRIAHYLKLIQRENIGTTKDRRLLELELNTWVRTLVTEMTDPGDELQASHPLRDAKVVVEDIEDNPGFFRVKLYACRTSRWKGWTSTCRWFPRCRKRNRKARAGMKIYRPLWNEGLYCPSTVPAAG
jgi:type VI secretion system protein ImpC